ncbi:RNA polymerase II degradation factor 1-like isoform X1 [Xenia sp. Carnegie-2017]|uniref:RNA polymerase II degradation factor 1-like isoform X1 n=1 Tax=Xenia sp. Carnegie-2017 TaxID=2897299 RepID=UPI001F045560|nr:RNA polymerase II degradation factor 1-like isoform X1 [Xenia sp. Carnegie-2017]
MKETLFNEKIKLHKDCSVMKTKAKELEKDKEISDKQCEKENKKVLFLLENIKDLKNEVNNEQRNREQLEKEMSETIDDEKEKIETLELKIKELQSKLEFDMNTCDSALQQLKSELSLSESLRSELEERITNYEKQLSDTSDKNANFQREIQVQNETIEKFTTQEQEFINEKVTLQQSVFICQMKPHDWKSVIKKLLTC